MSIRPVSKLGSSRVDDETAGVFYTSVFPYFNSYLQVVQYQSVTTAGYITSTFNLASTVGSILVGLLIRFTQRYKYFACFGACVYLLGIGLMLRYRTEDAAIGQIVAAQVIIGLCVCGLCVGGVFLLLGRLGLAGLAASSTSRPSSACRRRLRTPTSRPRPPFF